MPSGPKARKPVYPQRVPVVRSAGPGRTVGKPTDAPRGRNDGPPSILAPTASRRAATSWRILGPWACFARPRPPAPDMRPVVGPHLEHAQIAPPRVISDNTPRCRNRKSVIMARPTSGRDVVGAIVRGARDLHDLEIVGILDVRLRDLALIGDAVALAHHDLAEPLKFGAKPAAHHEDQMKAGVVRMARGAAARLELLDGAPDGPADAAVGRFRE